MDYNLERRCSERRPSIYLERPATAISSPEFEAFACAVIGSAAGAVRRTELWLRGRMKRALKALGHFLDERRKSGSAEVRGVRGLF